MTDEKMTMVLLLLIAKAMSQLPTGHKPIEVTAQELSDAFYRKEFPVNIVTTPDAYHITYRAVLKNKPPEKKQVLRKFSLE